MCQKPCSQTKRLCGSCTQKIRRHRVKLAGIKLLGGACVECGFDSPAALQFHHAKAGKRFNVAASANKSWEVLREEIVLCTLLCANCHAAKHSSRDDPAFLQEVANYRGKSLVF